MAILKNRMKDVAFYSGFSYLREVDTGWFSSYNNGWGAQEVNASYLLPAHVTERPPYVEFYVMHPSDPNTRYSLDGADQIRIGITGDRIYCSGYIIPKIPYSGDEPPFRIHFIIYGRSV